MKVMPQCSSLLTMLYLQGRVEEAKAVYEAALSTEKAKSEPRHFGYVSMQYARFLSSVCLLLRSDFHHADCLNKQSEWTIGTTSK